MPRKSNDVKGNTIGVRLFESDERLLRQVCRSRGEDISDFVRMAIRTQLAKMGYLPDSDKKALGLM